MKNSLANIQLSLRPFFIYSDEEPLSEYSPVTLHLSPATRILNGNPENWLMSEDI